MTNGDDHLFFYQTPRGRLFAEIDEVLPRGTKMGIKILPIDGNTSMVVYCAIICHLLLGKS